MAVTQITHLVRRGGIYYFRAAVPRPLWQKFGRREVKVSLRVSDLLTARRMCRECSSHFDQLLSRIATMPQLTEAEIEALVREYFSRAMAEVAGHAQLNAMDDRFSANHELMLNHRDMDKLRRLMAAQDYPSAALVDARGLAEASGKPFPRKGGAAFHALCQGVLRAQIEQRRIYGAMLAGRYDEALPRDPLFVGAAWKVPLHLPEQDQVPALTLGIAVEKFIGFKSPAWVAKTKKEYVRVLAWLKAIVGTKPITAVSLDDIRNFRDALTQTPVNATKHKAFNGKAPADLAKYQGPGSKLAPKTAAKYLDFVKTFLKWCVDEGYIAKSPAHSIKLASKEAIEDPRHPFKADQLKSLFNSPLYVGHQSASARHKPGTLQIRDGKFWIPLIGLFAGLRLGEIVPLRTTDIRKEQEVWIFDVNQTGEGKQLKTKSSKRFVPIHLELVHIGFLDFVDMKRSKDPNGRLFEDIVIGADGYASSSFSKFFGRYAKLVGVKTKHTTFHSFRHSFTDAMRDAGIPEDLREAMVGHKLQGMDAKYGAGHSIENSNAALNKIKYDLSLKHLYAVPKKV